MITEACKNCEITPWDEKDIMYIVGVFPYKETAKKNILSNLMMVYGVDYAASDSIYERIKTKIQEGVNSISGVEFAETNELGRVNRVDPLGITYLRIRGMWGIENPLKAFSYLHQSQNCQFELMALINNEKYNKLPTTDKARINELKKEIDGFSVSDVDIKNPDNPAQFKSAKLIIFTI